MARIFFFENIVTSALKHCIEYIKVKKMGKYFLQGKTSLFRALINHFVGKPIYFYWSRQKSPGVFCVTIYIFSKQLVVRHEL